MTELLLYAAIGVLAQLVDGALGMAFGVTSAACLLTAGVAPAVASAGVHTAKVAVSAVSGFSHWRLGNVDVYLFRRLALSGVVGAVAGAFVLTSFPGERMRPIIAVYLFVMGGRVLLRSLDATRQRTRVTTRIKRLGLAGGFLDAIGGGGWGPVVASTLLARGHRPHEVVGSVNLAEFFVSVAASVTLLGRIGFGQPRVIVGLVLGGMAVAPFAAWLCRRLPARHLMLLVGVLIMGLSLVILAQAW